MKKWLCVVLTVALFCLPMFNVVVFSEEEIVSDTVEVVDEEPIPEEPEDTPAEVEADTLEAETDEYPLADESATNDVETDIEEVLIETEEVSEEVFLASNNTWDIFQNELWRYNGNETNIVIPNNLGITSISSGTFKSNNIKSITVPKGVTELDNFVFSSLKGLTKVVLPEGLTEIPEFAFYACSNLREVNIPNTVIKIGDNAFSGCSSLENISIPNSVIDIGEDAFFECINLKSLSIPDGIEVVSEGICWGCSSLEKVHLGKNVNLISTYAFCDCTKLSTINFPSAITIIEYEAFYRCENLKSITLNNGLLIIGDWTFWKSNLDKVVIPETVTNMTKYSFPSQTVLAVYKGSYAHNFCVNNKLNYEVIQSATPTPALTPKPTPVPTPTPAPTPKPTPVPTQTAKYSISLTDVAKTNNTAGKGTVTATNGNLGSTSLYARVTWVYTLSSGDSFAYCAMKTVEMNNGSFNMVSPKAPYGATLDSVQIALVTDPYADASGTYTALATAKK